MLVRVAQVIASASQRYPATREYPFGLEDLWLKVSKRSSNPLDSHESARSIPCPKAETKRVLRTKGNWLARVVNRRSRMRPRAHRPAKTCFTCRRKSGH